MRRFNGLAGLLLLALSVSATAGTIIAPTGVTSDTSGTDTFAAARVIDGSGLPSATGNHFWDSADSWVTAAIPGYPSVYDFAGQAPRLVFDLGADQALTAIHVWGYSGGTQSGRPQANSMREFSLRFATSAEGPGAFGTTIALNPTYAMDADNVPSNAAGDTPGLIIPREDFAFSQGVTARWVEMTVLNNFYGQTQASTGLSFDGGDRVGFGEVRFSLVPVPPAALLGLGLLGTLGVASRLRRRRSA